MARRLVGAIVTAVAVAALVAVPGSVRAAVPETGTCPPGGSGGPGLAGYSMHSLAVGFRYALKSPGLLPFGDASEGVIFELDVPFSRVNVSGGPVIQAVGSPAYPGDPIAHLGTALGIAFGMPGIPNDPVLAESTYPPGPETPAEDAFLPTGLPGVAVFSGLARTSEKGGEANSHIATVGVPGVFSVGSAFTESDVDIQAGCVHSVARTVVGGIDIAGVIHIDGLLSYSAAASDGLTAKPIAEFSIGRVDVAGFQARIDRTGVHLLDQASLGDGVVAQVEATMREALAAANISVSLVPTTTASANAEEFEPAFAAADSGGLLITFEQLIPPIGEPGQGTPPIPTITEVLIGGSRVRVDATVPPELVPLEPLPAVGSGLDGSGLGGLAGLEPSAPIGGALGGGAAAAPTRSAGTGVRNPSGGTGGDGIFGPASSGAPLTSKGIPVGWIVVGIVFCIVSMGPLLGYARWQLLEGRI